MTNCFQPGKLWLDQNGIPINAHAGGILFHNGVYYWFGEHKVLNETAPVFPEPGVAKHEEAAPNAVHNQAHVGIHCYSSTDLYHWRDEGVVLRVSQDPQSPIVEGGYLERPKVLHNARTGKFVMWFHLEPKGTGWSAALSGVAVADQVTGPYRYLHSFRPDAGPLPADFLQTLPARDAEEIRRTHQPEGQFARDMTLFADEDGTAYLIAASEDNKTLHLSELTADYLRTTGRYIRLFPDGYNEAPAMFKYQGWYYLICSGCTAWAPNAARLARAKSIWGPWEALGNPCRGTPEENAVTFNSQSTFVLPVAAATGHPEAFIFMADRWFPSNSINSRYVWLPVEWEQEQPILRWHAEWDLSIFTKPADSH